MRSAPDRPPNSMYAGGDETSDADEQLFRSVDRGAANGCATPSTATSHAYARRTGGNVYARTCG